jgi:hypothetical protein
MAICHDRSSRFSPGALRATTAALVLCLLAACGRTVSMTGTADDAWNETIAVLREQGAMSESLDPSATDPMRERPRFDRAAGTIDLVYDESVYYGEGAAFLQLDVRRPDEARERSVRMWVDYPVGNNVVRYGRSIDDAATDRFHRAFVAARASLEATRRDKPASTTETAPEQGGGESTP